MPKIPIKFTLGTEKPPKLGTAIVKPTSEGKMSYAQNVEVQNDESGNAVLTPGPALVTIGNNSELTGVPHTKARAINTANNTNYIYFDEGLLGATNKVRRIKDVVSGSTPVIDTTGSITVAHAAHANPRVDDMVFRNRSGIEEVAIVGVDDSDTWIQTFTATDASPSLSVISTLTTSSKNFEHKIMVGSDAIFYIGHRELIDSVNLSNTYTANVLDLPVGLGVTALTEWQLRMVIAYNDTNPFTFAQRKSGGASGIAIWDFFSPSFEKLVPCPSRYISAVVNDPDGSLLVFGGVDEGKCTIYNFNGYGFNPLVSYIGDLPRSGHSVDFDGQGRVVWQTADGQICRYDKRTDIFEHLSSITTGSSAGGVLTRALGGTGNEFIAASGSGSTYTCKRMTFGNYIGDGDSADGVTTPLAISGEIKLPQKSIVTAIELGFNKALASGEKVEARLYKNGSTTETSLGTASFSTDGAVASKIIRSLQTGVDTAAIGVAWKMTDASATAPGVLEGYLHYNAINTL